MSKRYKFKKHQEIHYDSDIFPHKHCSVCNKMMDPEHEYCSEKCRNHVESQDKQKKKRKYRTVGIIVIVFVVILVIVLIVGNI